MKNVILTGGSRGLGLSHAFYLAKGGYNLAIIDISEFAGLVYGESNGPIELLSKLEQYGIIARFYACNLTDYDETCQIFDKIIQDFGSIDGLVCNAGGDVSGDDRQAAGGKAPRNSIEISIKNHDEVFDRNYRTCLNSIKAIIPHFKEKKSGKIVTTASISATFGVEQETTYAVSKAAVVHLTRCVARELRDYNVNVNCVAPAGTLTGRFKATLKDRNHEDREKILSKHSSPLKNLAEPAAISSVVEFFLNDASSYVSGQVLRVDGGQFTSPA